MCSNVNCSANTAVLKGQKEPLEVMSRLAVVNGGKEVYWTEVLECKSFVILPTQK